MDDHREGAGDQGSTADSLRSLAVAPGACWSASPTIYRMGYSSPKPIILILGPTAGGKTDLAIALAQRLAGGGECVCADSMQVYRGMNIGTAKPTAAQQALVRHHLLDVADPADSSFSVDRWLDLAEAAVADIRSRGRYPIVVGGTNLYVQALLYGLCTAPPADERLRAELSTLEPAALHDRLAQADPAGAARIHRNDRKRAIRAIEVYEQSGASLSSMQTQWNPQGTRRDVIILMLEYPVAEINRRINARVRAMIDAGLVSEVDGLRRAGRLGPLAGAALGYRQIADHLEGRLGLDEAVEAIKIRTRRFAKQQRSWLRRFRGAGRVAVVAAADVSQQDLVEQGFAAICRLENQGSPPLIATKTSPEIGNVEG